MNRAEFDAACATLELGFAISQTSGRRTTHRNKTVGGHPESWHLLGMGRDYVWDPWVKDDARALMRKRATQLGLRVVSEDDHDHIQPEQSAAFPRSAA